MHKLTTFCVFLLSCPMLSNSVSLLFWPPNRLQVLLHPTNSLRLKASTHVSKRIRLSSAGDDGVRIISCVSSLQHYGQPQHRRKPRHINSMSRKNSGHLSGNKSWVNPSIFYLKCSTTELRSPNHAISGFALSIMKQNGMEVFTPRFLPHSQQPYLTQFTF